MNYSNGMNTAIPVQLPQHNRHSHYETVKKAIEYLTENAQRQPTVSELAEQVGLSSSHLTKLFEDWAGISPKQLLKVITLGYAKEAVLHAKNNLDAAYSSGLSGGGRLYDLFITLEKVTPGEYKSMGKGLTFKYGFHDSPFGTCLISANDRGLNHLGFLEASEEGEKLQELRSLWPLSEFVEDANSTAKLRDHIFYPENKNSDLKVFLKGTPFQLKVWQALLDIPVSTNRSYSEVAKDLDREDAHRTCASAIGRNPVSYLIPCHRVLRKSLALGGYRWGLPRKQVMLAYEASLSS